MTRRCIPGSRELPAVVKWAPGTRNETPRTRLNQLMCTARLDTTFLRSPSTFISLPRQDSLALWILLQPGSHEIAVGPARTTL